MKKKLLVFLMVGYAFSTTFIKAQTLESGMKIEPERRKWEVGLDIFNLVSAFSSQNVNGLVNNQSYLIVRRYSMDKVKKSAIELKFGIVNQNQNTTDSFNNEISTLAQNYNFGLGYEFQNQSGKFMLFYGPRIRALVSVNSTDQTVRTIVSGSYSVSKSVGFGMSAGGFLGARFFINSRLSISASSNIEIYHDNSRSITKKLNSQTNELIQQGESANSFTNIIAGFSAVQIGYHF